MSFPHGDAARLVGRAIECRQVERLLEDAKAGHSGVLVVRGEPGIGKSALLRHAHSAAAGFDVVQATGVESEMELAFAGLHQLCAPVLDRVELLPEPQRDAMRIAFGLTTGRPPDRFLVGLALLTLLSEVSRGTPLLCLVDDAHWLDGESAHAMAFVARRLLADRICLLFGVRRAVEEFDGLPQLLVQGLDFNDARRLLDLTLRGLVDEQVRLRILSEAHGNPLALIEWSRGINWAEPGGGPASPAVSRESVRIEQNFRQRLAELPGASQLLLTVAAAEPTGDALLLWRAAARVGLDRDDADPAIEAGLLEVDTRVTFRHPLVRSIAYRDASVLDRQAAHRALADATDPGTDPDRRAWHLAEAAAGPDEAVAAELDKSAGRAQARGGRAAAAALLERSARLSVDPARRLDRTLAAASAKGSAGEYEAALELVAVAESGALDPAQRTQADIVRFMVANATGNAGDSTKALLAAARRLEPIDVKSARQLYLYAFGSACLAGTLAREATLKDVAAAARAAPCVDPRRSSDVLLDAFALLGTDGLGAAEASLRRAVGAYSTEDLAVGDELEYASYVGIASAAACVLWDFASLALLTGRWVDVARRLGFVDSLPSALNALGSVRLYEGDLDGAASLLSEAEVINEVTGNQIAPWFSPYLAALRGDDTRAEEVIETAVSSASAHSQGLPLSLAHWARATLHNAAGRYDKALTAGSEAMRTAMDWTSHLAFHELVEAATRAGRPDVAEHALDRLSEAATGIRNDWALGIMARSRALSTSGPTAEALYKEAIERLGRTALRPEVARAHLLYGEWLRRENRRIDARQHLREAYAQLSVIGMDAFAERARRELAATGETVRKRSVETLTELTPQELQIARLVGDGHTNPEIGARLFISARTVEYHLRKVFTKLEVTSRRELRARLRESHHPGSAP
jgi:DNA-binding CsgD family transcriptional regulator/tetratricopeptide (TPR) repeat protein